VESIATGESTLSPDDAKVMKFNRVKPRVPEAEEVEKVTKSIVRQGWTEVGPPSRTITIFPGDFVVHRDLGIAQYVEEEESEGTTWVKLRFSKEAEHLVRPEERARLSRLKSSDSAKPPKLTELTDKGRLKCVSLRPHALG
jgi:transcription-repair coupling factor (superfamily II helicase)